MSEVTSAMNLSLGLLLEGVTLRWSPVSGYTKPGVDHNFNSRAEIEQCIFRCVIHGLSIKKKVSGSAVM